MNIDFTNQIKELKEKDVLHKPFPVAEGGYALFAKNEEGNFVRVLFSNQDHVKKYLSDLGYDWGNEGKNEYTNFDSLNRLLTVMPELAGAETIAADPQWEISEKAVDFPQNSSKRTMEDMPDAVKLREVDHPVRAEDFRMNIEDDTEDVVAKDDKTSTSKKKLPPWLDKDKKKDKKDGKKGDKKKDKKGDKKEEGKNGKKLPPWLMKKKSKSKDYSELYRKVTDAEYGGSLKVGDNVKNVNKKCTHFGSEGVIKKFNDIPGNKGVTIAYKCTNAGKGWKEGDVLDKTPDQLELKR